jgi:hypothetical protein
VVPLLGPESLALDLGPRFGDPLSRSFQLLGLPVVRLVRLVLLPR